MSFDEVSFPASIAFGSTGGPGRRTNIVELASGFEERNATWANSRRRYDVSTGIKTLDQVYQVLEFFEARNGRLYGFRFHDSWDHLSCRPKSAPGPLDQQIGAGNGAQATFQLVKVYSSGNRSWTRTIKKPVAGSVRVSVAGAERTIGTHWTIDTSSGIVTFLAGSIPANGATVTAGFGFEVPVRFDTDQLDLSLEGFKAGRIGQIPLVELRL